MRRFTVFILLTVFLGLSLVSAEQVLAGKVKKIRGTVLVIRGDRTQTLRVGDPVFQNDLMQTGSTGAVGIIFEDNTILSLGPKSRLAIDGYTFAPEQGKLSLLLRLLRGTASYLSGIIGKQAPEAVKFQTPDATIGIRGTKFLVKVGSD